jgi:DnaJ-class molecular chaperone
MQHGLSSVRHPKGARLSQKGQAKEAEKMKKDGKCPTCRGMGKTPDGRYVCTTCNGTGKYEPTDDSTDKKQ